MRNGHSGGGAAGVAVARGMLVLLHTLQAQAGECGRYLVRVRVRVRVRVSLLLTRLTPGKLAATWLGLGLGLGLGRYLHRRKLGRSATLRRSGRLLPGLRRPICRCSLRLRGGRGGRWEGSRRVVVVVGGAHPPPIPRRLVGVLQG